MLGGRMQLDDLIPQIYEPVLDAGRWQDTLDALLVRLGVIEAGDRAPGRAEPG